MYNYNPALLQGIGEAQYQDNRYTGIARLDQARMNAPDENQKAFLNSVVTYAYGTKFDKNFPVLTQTQGMGHKRAVDTINGIYYNYLFGKPKTTSVTGKTTHIPGELIGVSNKPIFLYFKDRFFMKGQQIITGGFNGSQVRIHDNPVKEGSLWKYEAYNMKINKPVPYDHVKPGSVWGAGAVSVSLEHSRGTESRGQGMFRIKNYIKALRHSINLAGNVENKVMNFKIDVGNGQTFDSYVSWEKFLNEKQFNAARELDLLLSPYNADDSGQIDLVDLDSGKSVPSGMGLWDQIPTSNELNYTTLTERRFSSWIDDILSISGQADVMGEEVIDIMGGMGLMTEIDNALKRNLGIFSLSTDSDKFIRNYGDGLQAGYYFTSYKHRSGKVFRFTVHPMFEYGALADSSPRHPLNPSRPLTSYCGMIMNFGEITMDTKTRKSGKGGNIEYLYETGREYIQGTVRGMAQINGLQGGDIASDVDASAEHMMVTQGIHCNKPMSMGKILTTLS